MHKYEIKERTPELLKSLLLIWERSVRTTHHFLSDVQIKMIKEYVPQALEQVKHLIAASNEAGEVTAFMGVDNNRLEMLFIAPEEKA